MEIKIYKENTLSDIICKECIVLVKRRFKERWDIDRDDITISLIQNRINAIAFKNNEVVCILGLEETGELMNGCSKENVNGIYLLAKLAKELVKINDKSTFLYFALFPNTDLAIPHSSFIATKGFLSISNEVVKKNYKGNVLSLKRIELFTKKRINKTELINLLKES